MMPLAPSERCDAHALEISAFLDGELPFPACLPAVDHLASCESCRLFYVGTRRLSERLFAAPAPPATDAAWERIAGAGPSPAARSRRLFAPRSLKALGLAAAVVLAAALGVARFREPSPTPPSPTTSPTAGREIVVEGARGRMTDERFLSLIAEILSADSRYHRETERVLRFVLRREGFDEPAEPHAPTTEGPEAGEGDTEDGEPVRGGRTPIPLAS
ncbi:MAG: hypothetical protein IPN03_11890 [Holophagales bacterium]|nr:hypothetical protein [Holophagales bacterium]